MVSNRIESRISPEQIALQEEILEDFHKRGIEGYDTGFCVTSNDVIELSQAFGLSFSVQGQEALIASGMSVRYPGKPFVNMGLRGLRNFSQRLVEFAEGLGEKAEQS